MDRSVILNAFVEFLGILSESRKLYVKNKKLVLFFILFPVFLGSIFFLLNVFTIRHLFTDFFTKSSFLLLTRPNTPEFASLVSGVQEDFKLFVGLEYIFLVILCIAAFFFSIAIIRASAFTYAGRNVSIQDLMILTIKSWRKPFATWFYITLFYLGFYFFLLIALFPIVLYASTSYTRRALTLTLSIPAVVFESYLAVVWKLSLVVSILEETYGLEAFGKAARIAKGMKLNMFVLNLLCSVLSYFLAEGLELINPKQPFMARIVIGLVVVDSTILVRIFVQMAFTVFYFHCKNGHGEEVELQGSFEYTKIPLAPLVGEDVP